jgi:hypothetical protein
MSKKNPDKEKGALGEHQLKALAEWLKSHGSEAFKPVSQNKSEVERIIEKMSIIDEKAIREPYTV